MKWYEAVTAIVILVTFLWLSGWFIFVVIPTVIG